MSISKFKIKEGLDLDGLVLTNNNGTLYADGSAVGVTYIDSVSTDFDVTNGLLGLSQNSTIATKSYVDATAQGLDVKASVKVALNTNVNSSLNMQDPSDVNTPPTLDGVQLASGDRILLIGQNAAGENGIYAIRFAAGQWEKYRTDDATFDVESGPGTLTKGAFTFVESGTNAGKGFVVSSTPYAAGQYEVFWSQFSATGSYITSVGTNLSVGDGNGGTTLGELNLGANVLTTDSLGSVGAGYTAVSLDLVNSNLAIVTPSTDEISEGTNNQYFTQSRARDAFSAGAGIAAITNGVIEVNLSTGLEFRDGTSGGVRIDRDETDTWYDAAGAASTAETNANSYTDTALNDYTTTANLDTTIDGYGYLKSADLSGYATETYVDTAVGNIDLSSKQNVLTAGNGIDITNDTISLDSDVIVTSVALTDATTGVSAGSDVLGNATNTTYAMGSAQTVYTFATGTKTADIFVQIINASGDTRTSKITAVFNGGSAPIWTEYGIVDSGTAMATTVSFDSYAFKINITGSSTYAVHGVTTFLS